VGRDAQGGGDTVLVVAGLACIGLAALSSTHVIHGDVSRFVVSALAHGLIYLAAVWWVLARGAGPRTLLIILAMALVMRGISMTVPHNVLTTDALRYVWDGRIQWAGFNPYLYAPADERLAHLRDLVIFPFINQKETAVTIYPPVAEMIFMAGVAVKDSVAGMQLTMLAFESLLVWSLIGCLGQLGLPRERVLIYAWHPLPVWELASQAHIDAATAALVMLAVHLRLANRFWLAGCVIGLATATKYYPALLLAVLLPRPPWIDGLLSHLPLRHWRAGSPALDGHDRTSSGRKSEWLEMLLAFAATLVIVYLPYWWSAGLKVIGFLNRHLDNEGYWAGYGFHVIWLLRDFALADPPGRLYIALAAAVLAAILAWCFLARGPREVPVRALLALAVAFTWLTSPHYPWYFAWIVPLAALRPGPAVLAFTILPLTLYAAGSSPTLSSSAIYGLVFGVPLAMLVADRLIRRASRRPPSC